MTEYINKYVIIVFLVLFSSCKKRELSLNPVSYAHFEKFINETNYITDAEKYGGSGVGLNGTLNSENIEAHGRKHSLQIDLPPLATIILKITDPSNQ